MNDSSSPNDAPYRAIAREHALSLLSTDVDAASDSHDIEALRETIERADLLLLWPDMSPEQISLLHYFRSNAWACLSELCRQSRAAAWSWEQPELTEQILSLRRSLKSEGFANLPAMERARVIVNLGNAMSSAGRFVDAIRHWRHASEILPKFAMAQGNLGVGLWYYAMHLYDPNHKVILAQTAERELSEATATDFGRDGATTPEAIEAFRKKREEISDYLDRSGSRTQIEMDGFELGTSRPERAYRLWCLAEGLFINPLNDLGRFSIAASDVLTVPGHRVGNHGAAFMGFFNQIKQEFVSARWMLYQGLIAEGVHFSDRDVLMLGLDGIARYGLALEQVKIAYRLAYSIFDKAGYLLNSYFELGIKPREVYFKSLWYEKPNAKPAKVREVFERSENLPLRGLFWVAKDLSIADLRETAEPDAQTLDEVRNHLEHKYLQVTQPGANCTALGLFVDPLAYQIERTDLEGKTLRLLKLARSAIIYLSLAMQTEELSRQDGLPSRPMQLSMPTLSDRSKRR